MSPSSPIAARWLPLVVGLGALGAAAVVVVVVTLRPGEAEPPAGPPAASSLVREGARPVTVRSGDLDGDDVEEIVIFSVSTPTDELGFAAPYLEVFDARGDRWVRVFDATGHAPPGPGVPLKMLAPVERGFVSQEVQTVELVDLTGDGISEIVAGIANFGATSGPVELWILSLARGGSVSTEFYEASSRAGRIEVEGDRVTFEFGVYRKRDPGCCPSLLATQTIGWNPAAGRIEVLEESRRPFPVKGQ